MSLERRAMEPCRCIMCRSAYEAARLKLWLISCNDMGLSEFAMMLTTYYTPAVDRQVTVSYSWVAPSVASSVHELHGNAWSGICAVCAVVLKSCLADIRSYSYRCRPESENSHTNMHRGLKAAFQELINKNKPLWLRPASEVSHEETVMCPTTRF